MSLASLPPTTYAKDGRVYLAPSAEKLGALVGQMGMLWDEIGFKAEDAEQFPFLLGECVDALLDLRDRSVEEMQEANAREPRDEIEERRVRGHYSDEDEPF